MSMSVQRRIGANRRHTVFPLSIDPRVSYPLCYDRKYTSSSCTGKLSHLCTAEITVEERLMTDDRG